MTHQFELCPQMFIDCKFKKSTKASLKQKNILFCVLVTLKFYKLSINIHKYSIINELYFFLQANSHYDVVINKH